METNAHKHEAETALEDVVDQICGAGWEVEKLRN